MNNDTRHDRTAGKLRLQAAEDGAPTPGALNVGHGHVIPRPDGVRARCGGPGLCRECSRDLARQRATDASDRQCAWADYRKDYGVGEPEMVAAHKAFMAGWKAAREGDQSGPLR